jgi:membrane protein CcdC involved in cytochrome C biogenesis
MKNHKHVLKEIAKFATGLITADFLIGFWLLLNPSITPLNFLGITSFTPPILEAGMVFDILLLGILVHYAWHADIHTPSIKQKNLFVVVGIIMGIVGLAHLFRIIFGINIDIGEWAVPFWLSWVGTVVALYISYASFRFAIHRKK